MTIATLPSRRKRSRRLMARSVWKDLAAMPRPVTLFTGQWADLPIAELAAKCGEWGFDGLELASWGDHFDVARALEEPATATACASCSSRHGLGCWAISNHLVGQAVCDPIDERHAGDPAARGVGRRRPRRRALRAPPSA